MAQYDDTLNMREILAHADLLWLSLDTLRFDVAQIAFQTGLLNNMAQVLSEEGWECRHTPGSFTYAAHQAFFAGFLPTPAIPGKHPRLFALQFAGSETTKSNTLVFETPTIIEGFANLGLTTICIGGVGFFNLQPPLGCVLPSFFQHAYWSREMGVTHKNSTEHQVQQALDCLNQHPEQVCLFINISALHQPNNMYLANTTADCPKSQLAALAYVDQALAPLFARLRTRRPCFVLMFADHGTAYGDDGFHGHRLAHPSVWDVPYAHGWLG